MLAKKRADRKQVRAAFAEAELVYVDIVNYYNVLYCCLSGWRLSSWMNRVLKQSRDGRKDHGRAEEEPLPPEEQFP